MTPQTFIFILNTVGPGFAKENKQLRDSISVEKIVVIGISKNANTL